jgi:heme/copper-type cytochrome/quinol oxidase subunit 3
MHSTLQEADHESGPPIESARFGLWLFLGSEVLLFAGLIGSYLFLRTGARSFGSPGAELERLMTAFNTLLLVASSFTVARAVKAADERARARWLGATLLLGSAFLGLQVSEYAGLLGHGILPRTSLYWSCFFVLTGVHGLHVLGGLVALAWTGRRARSLDLASLYWHFVDGVWILLFALLYLGACQRVDSAGGVLAAPADSAEVFGEVRPFQLTDQTGAPVTLASLKGHAWAACFVFTRCSGPCPKVSATMKRLQSELSDPDVRLVSVSVDGPYDTPAVLARYAEALGADPKRWKFLTGDEQEIAAWIRTSFLSPVERDATQPVGESITHRTSIEAVDKQGKVRGFYEGEDASQLDLLRARLEWLQKQ